MKTETDIFKTFNYNSLNGKHNIKYNISRDVYLAIANEYNTFLINLSKTVQ